MTEKRFKVAVYDEKAINGFTVLDLHKPNSSKRLKYENVYIGSKEGCDIVCKFGNELAEENIRLKKERNHFERKKTEYLTEWNTCRIQNTELKKENERLKTQLLKEEDVCDICKHQYLVASQKVKGFYIAKCEKEHEECGKGTVRYCKDFKFKELK